MSVKVKKGQSRLRILSPFPRCDWRSV